MDHLYFITEKSLQIYRVIPCFCYQGLMTQKRLKPVGMFVLSAEQVYLKVCRPMWTLTKFCAACNLIFVSCTVFSRVPWYFFFNWILFLGKVGEVSLPPLYLLICLSPFLLFQWWGAKWWKSVIEVHFSSLNLPLKDWVDGVLCFFPLWIKLLELVLSSTVMFAKFFKIPGFSLAESCVNLLFWWPPLKLPWYY